jgi:hypothetical protein
MTSICAYGYGGCGATGYEGPTSTFSDISADETSGVVDFPSGLAAGTSTYFSLEAAVAGATVQTGAGQTPETVGEQGAGPNPSEHSTTCSTAQPVNCATGTFWHTFNDLSVPGRGVPLSFARPYTSAAASVDGRLGYGWGCQVFSVSARSI